MGVGRLPVMEGPELVDEEDAVLFGDFGQGGEEAPTGGEGQAVPAWDELQRLAFEKEALGFYLTDHPLNRYASQITNLRLTTINSLQQNTTTPATVNTAGKTFQLNQIAINSGLASLTIGSSPGSGVLTTGSMGGNLTLVNNSGFAPGLVINAVLADNIFPSSLTVAGSGMKIMSWLFQTEFCEVERRR